MASYNNCDFERLTDRNLPAVMQSAIENSGASILTESVHFFPNGGMTAVFLLSESHASIHTYPEHSSCFVDLFTCGEKASLEEFDSALRKFLRPQNAERKIVIRHQSHEDLD